MKKIKWGIIGPGEIANSFMDDMQYVSGYKNEVISVMSNTMKSAEEFAEDHKVTGVFDSVKKMLEKEKPDVVYISSPHSAHYEETMICLEHKVPVLCEKPIALNLQQAAEMVSLSKKNQTFLLEGMWIRFLPSIRFVLELLRQGAIGKIKAVEADMSYVAPKDKDNRFYNPELGGGSLLDLGIYPVYLSLLLLGKPDGLDTVARLTDEGIDENCKMIFNYNNGALALLESSIIKETSKEVQISGERGTITIQSQWNEKPAAISVSLLNDRTFTYPCEWEGRGFQFEINEVLECISKGKIESSLHSHQDTLNLMSTLDMIRARNNIVYTDATK